MAIDPKFVEYLLAAHALGLPAPNRFSGSIQRFMRGGTVDPDGMSVGPGSPGPSGQPNGNVVSAVPGQSPYPNANPAGGTFTAEGSQAFSNTPYQSGFQAKVPLSTIGFNPNQYQGTVNGAQSSLGRLSGMLMNEANGGGPNLAAQQERQATDRNIAQQFALAQANPNNPGAAKAMLDNAGAMNQQAAADSAAQRMQQQLAAQGQLQQLGLGQLGTAGSLMTDQQRMQLSQAQGNQQAALTAQGQNLQQTLVNQQLAETNLQGAVQVGADALKAGGHAVSLLSQGSGGGGGGGGSGVDWTDTASSQAQDQSAQNAISGIGPDDTSGDASASGDYVPTTDGTAVAARGGIIPHLARMYADGGAVTDPNSAGSLQAYNYAAPSQMTDPHLAAAPVVTATTGAVGPVSAAHLLNLSSFAKPADPQYGNHGVLHDIGSGVGDVLGGIFNAIPVWGAVNQLGQKAANGLNNANGSSWANHAMGGTIQRPSAAQLAALLASGGAVPGHAAVAGNSYANDTVPAVLSPGEVVLPRSVTQSAHPADAAAAFVRHLHGAQRFADGGSVPAAPPADPSLAPDLDGALKAQPEQPRTYGFESGSALNPAPGSEVNKRVLFTPSTMNPAMQSALASQEGAIPASPQPTTQPKPTSTPSADNDALLKMILGATQPRPTGGTGGGSDGRADYLQGVKQQQAAIEAQGKIDAQKAQLDAAAAQHKADLLTQVQAQDKARQNAYDAEYNRQTQALQDAMTQFSKINTVVDPSRYWDSRSTGQKVLASIGVFLGGLGGGHNEAAASIQDAINRDVEAQKATISANMEKGRQGILNRTNLIGIGREKFSNDLQAESFAKATMLDAAAAQADAQAARLGDPIAKQKVLALKAELLKAKGQQLNTFSNQAQELALRKSVQNLEMAKTGVELMRSMGQGKAGQAGGTTAAAIDALQGLKAQFAKANKGAAGIGSSVAQAFGDSDAGHYNHMADAMAPLVAQAVYGGQRAATPEMVESIRKQLPGFFRSQGSAEAAFDSLIRSLKTRAAAGADMPETSDLDKE